MQFDRGDPKRPRGHALAYVRSTEAGEEILATYLVVPPMGFDLAKYIPPLLATKLPLQDFKTISAVPLPPVPETVESYEYLVRLAELRDDDLVALGTARPSEVERLLQMTAEAAQRYHQLYQDYLHSLPPVEPPAPELGYDADEILFTLLSDREKLGELARHIGQLRDAVERREARQIQAIVGELERLGRYLPEKYRIPALIAAAQLPGERGHRLSELYVRRGFKLCDEDYAGLEEIDRQIERNA